VNKNNNYWGWDEKNYYVDPLRPDRIWFAGARNNDYNVYYNYHTYTYTSNGGDFNYSPPKKITKEELM